METKILRVMAPHFDAGAVYVREGPGQPWRCTRAAPIIRWLVGMSPADARERLARVRYQWEWVEQQEPPADVPQSL